MDRAMLNPAVLWSMVREAVTAWTADFAPSMGAGIAYYTAFSVAPLLVIVISIAGVFLGKDMASGYVYGQITDILGPQGAESVRVMVANAQNTRTGVIAPVISIVLLIVGATSVFAELQSDLDRIWKAPALKRQTGLWSLFRTRLLSLGLVVSIGFLLLVSLVISTAVTALARWWSGWLEDLAWALHVVDLVLSVAVTATMFALMYRILPRVRIGWEDVWVGSITTALLFTIGKLAVGFYIGESRITTGFGTAGSLVVLVVWVYYSAQIFLLGAEFTWLYAYRFGSRRGEDPHAARSDDAQADAGKDSPTRTRPAPPAKGKTAIAARPSSAPTVPAAAATPPPRVREKWMGAAKAAGWVAAAFGAGAGIEYAARRFGVLEAIRRQSTRLAHRFHRHRFGWRH
jgi:membrane protein